MRDNLWDNCIQTFHLGRYIVRYTVGNLVLWRRGSGAVKRVFQRIYDDIPPQMKSLNIVISILMHFCSFVSNWSVASHIIAHHLLKCDVINDIMLFPTVYPTVYCRIYTLKFSTLSIQKSRYKSKCIRIFYDFFCGRLTSFKINFFKKLFRNTVSECLIVWIQIWVQTVCKRSAADNKICYILVKKFARDHPHHLIGLSCQGQGLGL